LAALIGGSLVSRFGYAVTLSGSAVLACLAAACFQMLLRERRPVVTAPESGETVPPGSGLVGKRILVVGERSIQLPEGGGTGQCGRFVR